MLSLIGTYWRSIQAGGVQNIMDTDKKPILVDYSLHLHTHPPDAFTMMTLFNLCFSLSTAKHTLAQTNQISFQLKQSTPIYHQVQDYGAHLAFKIIYLLKSLFGLWDKNIFGETRKEVFIGRPFRSANWRLLADRSKNMYGHYRVAEIVWIER